MLILMIVITDDGGVNSDDDNNLFLATSLNSYSLIIETTLYIAQISNT